MPGGILLEPNTGLAINDFSAGVEFFKTLPSIDEPEQLRGPDFQLPTAQSAEQWLASVNETDLYKLPIAIQPRTCVLSVLCVLFFQLVARWACRRRVYRLNVVKTLKSRE